MRKLEDYRIKNFAFDDRCWRIDWLGAITYNERYRRTSQPLIEVQLSCVPQDITDPNDFLSKNDGAPRDTRQVLLPVGFLPLLRIGDIWEDGRLVASPAYDVGDFPKARIGGTTTSTIKAGLNADEEGNYYLPWEHHPFHMKHTQSYCALIKYGEVRIVVPATELIRFYFGTSGDLIARLFDAPFDPNKFWNSATPAEAGNNAKIDLESRISCRSASTVARIAFSRDARYAAEAIGKSCIAAVANGQRPYPKAYFPFEGDTDLVASGRWLPFKGVERGVFLVFQLLSCTYPFPFNGLEYTGERRNASNGKSRFGQNAKSEPTEGANRFSRSTKDPKSVVDEEPDKNKKPREINLDPLKREQFPDLCKKRITKVDVDFVPTVVMAAGTSPDLDAVSVGDAGTNCCMQPVDFIDAGPILDTAATAAGARARKFDPAVEVFLGLISSLTVVTQFGRVGIVRLDRRQRHDYLCTLPQIVDVDGVVHPWCLVNGANTSRNRKISIARAEEIYATHYILVPELRNENRNAAAKLELHLITDKSRSIAREADLLAALTIHLARAVTPNTHTTLAEGVESIWHELDPPADTDSLSPIIAAAREYFAMFAQPGARPESTEDDAPFIQEGETVAPAV